MVPNKLEIEAFVRKEIRLAMQQQMSITSALDRDAIALIRARRIIDTIDGIPVGDLTEVNPESIKQSVDRILKGD
jgi:hypothetical protein